MQSKPSKNRNGRSANAMEKAFHGFLKSRPCCWCGSESGSIVDHVVGAKTGHNKVHIGHWFCLPNCQECDERKTIGGEKLGDYSAKWELELTEFECSTNKTATDEVIFSIADWGLSYQNGA